MHQTRAASLDSGAMANTNEPRGTGSIRLANDKMSTLGGGQTDNIYALANDKGVALLSTLHGAKHDEYPGTRLRSFSMCGSLFFWLLFQCTSDIYIYTKIALMLFVV